MEELALFAGLMCTHACVSVRQYGKHFVSLLLFCFWQYSSGSTPLTGMEAGLLTTTTSSSMCITVIGSEVTGTSCLQHTNRNQLNVALLRLHYNISRIRTWMQAHPRALSYTHTYIYTHARAQHTHIHAHPYTSIVQQVAGSPWEMLSIDSGRSC